MTREQLILAAIIVGLVDLVVLRLRGGLRLYRRVDIRRFSHDVWKAGGWVTATGLELAPHFFVGIVRSKRRMKPVRMRHTSRP
jgi:hypothetical protein